MHRSRLEHDEESTHAPACFAARQTNYARLATPSGTFVAVMAFGRTVFSVVRSWNREKRESGRRYLTVHGAGETLLRRVPQLSSMFSATP